MSTSEMDSGADMCSTSVDPQVASILRSLAPEEVDMLRDAFIHMDRDSDGFVSREEMMEEVLRCVGAERFGPLEEYLLPLFSVADKDKDGKLSLTEFLMAFAEGPGVVPAEVINSCVANVRVRLTDEEISALQESFRRMDVNQDGYVDPEELEAALRTHLLSRFPDLTDENFAEVVTVVMTSADADRDGRLSLSEFIRSYQEDQGVLPAAFLDTRASGEPLLRQLSEEEMVVLREAFAVLDKNSDGYLDVGDLYTALWDTLGSGVEDDNQIRDLCDLIMITADRGHRGELSVNDFIRGFLDNIQLMQIPVAVAQGKVRSACDRLQHMYDSGELEKLVMVFEDLDHDGDGYLDRQEMVHVLKTLFEDAFPNWNEEVLTAVLTAIVVGAETNNRGRLSLEEFIRSFVEGPGVLPPETVTAWNSVAASATARQGRRVSTATDDDLSRISEALRRLHSLTDADGCITAEQLRDGILAEYTASANPQHGEEMVQYAMQQFVAQREDGRLEWNENVIFQDEEEAELRASALASRTSALASHDAAEKSQSDAAPAEQVPASAGSSPSTRRQRASVSASAVDLDVPVSAPGASSDLPPATPRGEEGEEAAPAVGEAAVAVDVTATLPKQVEQREVAVLSSSGSSTTLVTKKPLPRIVGSDAGEEGAVFDDELRQMFNSFDKDRCGYLDREWFKKEYMRMEHYGLVPSPAEVDHRFRRYSHGSDKIGFNEFCILMLERARM